MIKKWWFVSFLLLAHPWTGLAQNEEEVSEDGIHVEKGSEDSDENDLVSSILLKYKGSTIKNNENRDVENVEASIVSDIFNILKSLTKKKTSPGSQLTDFSPLLTSLRENEQDIQSQRRPKPDKQKKSGRKGNISERRNGKKHNGKKSLAKQNRNKKEDSKKISISKRKEARMAKRKKEKGRSGKKGRRKKNELRGDENDNSSEYRKAKRKSMRKEKKKAERGTDLKNVAIREGSRAKKSKGMNGKGGEKWPSVSKAALNKLESHNSRSKRALGRPEIRAKTEYPEKRALIGTARRKKAPKPGAKSKSRVKHSRKEKGAKSDERRRSRMEDRKAKREHFSKSKKRGVGRRSSSLKRKLSLGTSGEEKRRMERKAERMRHKQYSTKGRRPKRMRGRRN